MPTSTENDIMIEATKWTEKAIAKEAKKYETRSEFIRGNGAAYYAAWKAGILDKVCSHMEDDTPAF